MADQDDRVALARELDRFEVNLRDQRAGGVDDLKLAALGLLADRRRYPVRAENDSRALRHLRQLLYENGARLPQFIHDVAVVDDLLPHIDRRAIEVQYDLDDIDRPHHAGAESPRPEQDDLLSVVGL